jgi:peroxiredoxin
VKSWASDVVASRRTSLRRTVLALLMLGVLVWALPSRRHGEDDHHQHDRGSHGAAPHARPLDAFERAGITELREGQHGPPFSLGSLDGGTTTLAELTRDRLVVLNFWATWCQPCTLEMPTLEALGQHYRERGLTVVGISVDRGAPRDLILPYVRALKLTFPVLLDPEMKTAGAWRVTGVPATFVIKPGGEVVGMAVGAREWDSVEMRALLEPMLPR